MSGINLQESETNLSRIVQAVIQILRGSSNSVGNVTLRASQTTTTVTKSVDKAAVNVSADQEVFLSPKTANAAGALATTFISAVGQGTFTITHASAVSTDRTFGWEARG